MDYKKLIKRRETRVKILRLLSFIPDIPMLKFQYRVKTGHRLNLKSPKRFTEKLQWYKLYYHDPLMIKCVDKYDVREYVKGKGLERILIPCYGVFDSADQIDWEALPEQFVLKDTLGGGGNAVIIIENKSAADIAALTTKAEKWTSADIRKKNSGREWPYYNGKNHRIIIEKRIGTEEKGLTDYKFFCFNGKVEFLYVTGNRVPGQEVSIGIYDRNLKKMPVRRVGDHDYQLREKPDNYFEMLEIAEKLAEEFPHVRVDLYNIRGKIFFGEMTFYNASGYMLFDPDEFDVQTGDLFLLPERCI